MSYLCLSRALGHREKMRLIGKEDLLEPLNKEALKIAKKVAAEGNALVAGNICNTNIYDAKDEESAKQVRAMFEEQVQHPGAPRFSASSLSDSSHECCACCVGCVG